MATVSILHDIRKRKTECPVVFVIRNNNRHSHLDSGLRIKPKDFDPVKLLKKSAPVVDYIAENTKLRRTLSEIETLLSDLTASGEIYDLSPVQIKERFIQRRRIAHTRFISYFKEVIKSKKAEKTKLTYQHTLNLIQEYKLNLEFQDITPRFLREFETWLEGKGMKVNTISIHMRNIRAVFNRAITDEIIDLNFYPFRKFKIRSEKTIKRNLTIDELKKLREIELTGVPGLARDVFFLSFYLIGINLIDLCYLTKDNIKGGRIEYKRRKTGKHYSIKLEPEAKRLIKKLRGRKYLICLLERYACYENAIKEIDKKLKVAATKAKIDKPVSSYFCRHSWASIASKLDIPKETISAALGHEIGSATTAIYID